MEPAATLKATKAGTGPCFNFVHVALPVPSQSPHKSKLPQKCHRRCPPLRRCRIHLSAEQPSTSGNPQELRAHLLELVAAFGRSGGVNAAAVDDVEAAVRALLSSRGGGETPPLLANDLDPTDTAPYTKRLEGRWDLRYSTEGPLLKLMTDTMFPFLATGEVYQVFRGDGTLQVSYEARRVL